MCVGVAQVMSSPSDIQSYMKEAKDEVASLVKNEVDLTPYQVISLYESTLISKINSTT